MKAKGRKAPAKRGPKDVVTMAAEHLHSIQENRKYVSGYRADGLKVFLDKYDSDDEDKALLDMMNKIRCTGTKEQVILAVSLLRATQIARSYARTYAPEVSQKIMTTLKAIMGGSNMYGPKQITDGVK